MMGKMSVRVRVLNELWRVDDDDDDDDDHDVNDYHNDDDDVISWLSQQIAALQLW